MVALAQHKNERVALSLAVLVAGMVGLAFAAVPLYDLFCRVTGFGGTTQVATEAPKGVIDRMMKVSFDASVASNLAWQVTAARPVEGNVGSVQSIVYTATNTTDAPVTGTSIFNVTPEAAGIYFNKMECFCFTTQTLMPGETVEMPVVFFVDPELDKNRDLDTVREITLSYTFYASENEGR